MANSTTPPDDLVSTLRRAGCVFAEDEALLLTEAATSPAELTELTQRRISGTPLEHILGWAQFCGLRIPVATSVFVPRHRTEFLARTAAAHASPGAVVVDMCCGSGAVGIAVAELCEGIHLHCSDIDPASVGCARSAVEAAGGSIHQGDLFDALPHRLLGKVDVVVANTPYVPTDEIELMPSEARLHEPLTALDGGGDGLDVQRRLIAQALDWLAPDGHLVIETSARQCEETVRTCLEHGFTAESAHSAEFAGTVVIARIGGARRPALVDEVAL